MEDGCCDDGPHFPSHRTLRSAAPLDPKAPANKLSVAFGGSRGVGAEAEVPRAVTAVGGRGMLVLQCMPRHASGVSLTLGCPPVHEESRVHGSCDGLHRRELHGVWRGGGVYRGRVRVHAVQRLLLQRCNLVGVTCSIRRSRRTSSRNCTVSEPEREGERGGGESNVCAPGSTIQRHVSSREQNQAVFLLPGAHSCDACAPGSTIQRYLCSREGRQRETERVTQ